MLILFDMERIVQYEPVPEDQRMNQQHCVEVLKRLRLAVCRKRPKKRASRAWALHCDNAHAHTARSFQASLANHGIPVVQQPPYSPDMAPCDFWLIPRFKMATKGKKFDDIDTIKENTTKHLSSILKDPFKKCFPQRQHRWHKYIPSQGTYVEWD
jgi:hypothetical protein